MEKILKEFLNNDEAMDAYVDSKTTYLSIEDIDILLKTQKEQLRINVVDSNQVKLKKRARAVIGREKQARFDGAKH